MIVRRWATRGLLAISMLTVLVVALVLSFPRKVPANQKILPDGSILTLLHTEFTATNFSYSYQGGNRFTGLLAPILPAFLASKLPAQGGGGFGFGLTGTTNLIVITHHRRSNLLSIGRLRVVSDATNVYDACWGAHTLGLPAETVNGWQIRAFPRRSPKFTLQFLAKYPDGHWVEAASFIMTNPAFADFPRWSPESHPIGEKENGLEVSLSSFRSGALMEQNDPATAPRKTELLFGFKENGHPTENWRVQKLVIRDATGNDWFPYLDLVRQDLNWARGGRVEFLGALWPGEDAWKLDVELVRTGEIPPEDLYDVELPLPPTAGLAILDHEWNHGGITLRLLSLASPDTDHPGNSKWTGKYWGDNKDKVFSLVVSLKPENQRQRLNLVNARDQTNASVEIVEHRGQDHDQQAFFLKPAPNATAFRLTFSLSTSRFVQFLAKPEFVRE